ncbi:DUF6480 family protein [Mycolicibacterium hippocampi]|uniref:Uncharacterized protein n=1 Tax=Mycolicibacterium hippocampi TaxID=659824 RepID=A0A7I9ZKC5_9MYCO|nr:DUF6480 family protein [Mycolicibacterium hippocampi]GFH01414.1 hypothetical protein MHIP_18970 [Mycolicibacterium hippocampi]
MTALPPDPDPMRVPREEPAGGVPPGETPPDSAQTSATSNADPTAGRNLTPRAIAAFVAIGLFAALFAVTAVVLVLQLLD